MRRKPSQGGQGGYNNQSRGKPRYQGGGSGGGDYRSQNNNNGNRPRKNYSALREKYLAQARDALASGDRVLAENYFQHAEHCYRMMVEEGYNFRNNNQQQSNEQGAAEQSAEGAEVVQNMETPAVEEHGDDNVTQLPAFLTANFAGETKAAEVPVQDWEERDQG